MLAAIGVAMLGGIAAVATTAQAVPEPQVWVCKYVGTPFVNETLQNKDGLIRVNANSTGDATVGNSFADQQGRSYVLDVATDANTSTGGGEGEQYTGTAGPCPAGQGPVTATVTFTPGNCDARGSAWCLMSMCSRNGLRVPHLICSRNLVPQGEGLVLGGEDEGLLDPVDVARQVGRVGLGIEHL